MTCRFARDAVRTVLLPPTLIFLAGCTEPLGPGFRIEKQSVEMQFTPGANGGFQVRAEWRLKNKGNRHLPIVEVEVPNAQAGNRVTFLARLNGLEVAVPDAGNSRLNVLRIPLEKTWARGERLNLNIAYTIVIAGPMPTDSANLTAWDWFPKLRQPQGLFGEREERAEKTSLRLTVPSDFLVLTSGRAEGKRAVQGGVEWRFSVLQSGADPYFVAGRYVDCAVEATGRTIVFWTFHPLERARAERAAHRLGTTLQRYESAFGPAPGAKETVHLVEVEQLEYGHIFIREGWKVAGFPGGIFFDGITLRLGVDSEAFLDLAEFALARIWFGWRLAARWQDAFLLEEGAPKYATILAAEARGGVEARRSKVRMLLEAYDAHAREVPEKLLGEMTATVPRAQNEMAAAKGALVFIALEDQFGKEALQRALTRLMSSLGGQNRRYGWSSTGESIGNAGRHDLRAALEGETGANLAEFFRAWLNETGIPSEFRARYEK